MEIFGFEIKRNKKDKDTKELDSIVSPSSEDGSTLVTSSSAYYGTVLDIEGTIKTENDLIRRYREVSQYADCDSAIEDIVNEAIVTNDEDQCVKLNLDNLKVSDAIKEKLNNEFKEVIRLFKFDIKGHDIFRQWYIDGRLYYHILVDKEKMDQGIVEMRYVNPIKIRRIKNVDKQRNAQGVEINKTLDEYYLYNDRGMQDASVTQGVKLSLDSIVFCPSGIQDANNGMMLSPLHKAIKPVNQLKMIEDACVIYRISRAPERRVFYVDVGTLPKVKAEQYVNDIMNKFRNKIVYDANTGETTSNKKHLSIMEDFWMPRREGGKGTEITTLPGGQNLSDIQDIEYFQKKLYQALNVPMTRLQQSTGFALGRSSEIGRDEIKFNKFVSRLRKRFSVLFSETLRVQLILKKIIRPEEWVDMEPYILFNYQQDNHFNELKDAELLQNRITILQQIDPYIGRFYSAKWIRKNLLLQTDEDIAEQDKEMESEQPSATERAFMLAAAPMDR